MGRCLALFCLVYQTACSPVALSGVDKNTLIPEHPSSLHQHFVKYPGDDHPDEISTRLKDVLGEVPVKVSGNSSNSTQVEKGPAKSLDSPPLRDLWEDYRQKTDPPSTAPPVTAVNRGDDGEQSRYTGLWVWVPVVLAFLLVPYYLKKCFDSPPLVEEEKEEKPNSNMDDDDALRNLKPFPDWVLGFPIDEGTSKKSIALNEKREEIKKILKSTNGLKTVFQLSRDKDEEFWSIMASEELLLEHAHCIKFKMQLKPSLFEDEAGAKDVGNILAPFDKEIIDIFERRGKNGSFFTSLQRQRILIDFLQADEQHYGLGIDLGKLKVQGVLSQSFPMRDSEAMDSLHKGWAGIAWFRLTKQPIDEVNDYFGEKIAIYFYWLEHYDYWLICVTLLGFLQFAFRLTMGINNKTLPGYCVAIVLAGALYLAAWKQHLSRKVRDWDIIDHRDSERPRPQFYGEQGTDPWTGQPKRYFSQNRRMWIKVLTSIPVFLFTCCALAGAMWIMKNKADEFQWARGPDGPKTLLGRILVRAKYGGMTAGFMITGEIIYGKLAHWLNDLENHETQTQYEDSLIAKMCLFEFINSYSPVAFVAFIQGSGLYPVPCAKGNCMLEAETLVAIIFFVKNYIFNLREFFLPIISRFVKITIEDQIVKWQNRKEGKSPEEFQQLSVLGSESKYGDLWMFKEYQKMIFQFGFITLFAAANPLLPLLGLINNLIEIRSDAYKILKYHKRPPGEAASDIGTWYYVMVGMVFLASITNSLMICFSTATLAGQTLKVRAWAFVASEHVMIVLAAFVFALIPWVPQQVAFRYESQKYLKEQALFEAHKKKLKER